MINNAKRIYLSPPHMSGNELNYIQKAFDENYITTVGANITAFEKEIAVLTGAKYTVALNSGTAAIHLALRILGVGTGDEVLCSTFSFVATANPVLYLHASPVFIDSETDTWNMCPEALLKAIKDRIAKKKKPKAIILVHSYGMPAKLDEIVGIANQFEIPIIEDAAAALGSTYKGKPLGSFGTIGIFSFNGNKIITTSGGGAFVTDNADYAERALFLATQARDPAPHYQHSQEGYNYSMSNIVAGVGLGQLTVLPERIQRRRVIYYYYQEQLSDIPGISFLPEPTDFFSNRWLSCLLLPPEQPVTAEELRQALEAENIEARHLWNPLHLQPLFASYSYYGEVNAENLFKQGLCLPSGSALQKEDLDRIINVIKSVLS